MADNLEYLIMKEMSNSMMPIGASFLALRLNASQATIGRVLQELEYRGYACKASNKGRLLTEEGQRYFKTLQKDASSESYASELMNLIGSDNAEDLIYVLETRILLERYTIRQTCLKATNSQLSLLKDIIDRQVGKQSHGELGEEENLAFHITLATIAGNSVIEKLLRLIMTQNTAYVSFSLLQYRVAARNTNDHSSILEAINNRDVDLADRLIIQHLESLIKDVKKIVIRENSYAN